MDMYANSLSYYFLSQTPNYLNITKVLPNKDVSYFPLWHSN